MSWRDSDSDLPAALSDLPALTASLPSRSSFDPSESAGLPVPAAALPAKRHSTAAPGHDLPVPVAPSRGFGEIELPSVAEVFPARTGSEPTASARSVPESEMAQGFGEIDLPREAPTSPKPSPDPPMHGTSEASEFRDFELAEPPPPRRSSGAIDAVTRPESGGTPGGMNFGEVDLGGADGSNPSDRSDALPTVEGGSSGVSDTDARPEATSWRPPAAALAASQSVGRAASPASAKRRASPGRIIALVALMLLLTGGAALQLTPYGAYGYLVVSDVLRSGDYARATAMAMREAEAILGPDTYEGAKAAMALAYAAHSRTPRAKPLTAYGALVDSAASLRFGADTTRASRAKQLLLELPLDQVVKYRDVAIAAQFAEAGDFVKARSNLDLAGKYDSTDPVQVEIALLRGDVDLAIGDGPAALSDFKRALALYDDARAHFGLARAFDSLGEAANARMEIGATLARSPKHVGALTLRARRQSEAVDPASAIADLSTILDTSVQAAASPAELSDAYAARAWVRLELGEATAAREAFGRAVSLNPSNIGALNGEGRLLLNEGRYAEALARLDKALELAPNSPQTIASDAEAKLELERLSDAKQQLVAAQERFPKNTAILLLLARVEERSGEVDAAEGHLRLAISNVDPLRPEAVLPYIALCELDSARGRLNDAKATLEDAKKALPPSSALERAFGEFDERQGDFEGAIAHYRSAIAKGPKDVAAHFRLAVALRRVRRFDEASAELDRVAAVDRDYPGIFLERGLLFEDSGDVEHAIEQFKTALSKAPEDPDLQLRVGSAYVAIGRPDDALPMLHKVLDKRPASAEANHYIGRALLLQGGSAQPEALRYLKRAVDLDPNCAEFHVYLAWAANDVTPAQLELARDEIDRALALDKMNAEAYWQRGVLERMEGAIDDAVADEKRALELRPARSEAHATLAECYEDKNDDAAALAEWPRALAGDGGGSSADATIAHPYWHYRYGKLLFERGSGAAAVAQLVPAAAAAEKLESRPGWVAPLEFLVAEALRGAGRRADAIDHYRRFLDIAPVNSPDRYDAQKALSQLAGKPDR
ncbi:MAG: tetratricopeptide repeat protein [Polyangiaceae bacterium]